MAKPTTIILRYSNNLIDEISKDRYHKKLNEKVKGLRLPIKKENEVKEDDISLTDDDIKKMLELLDEESVKKILEEYGLEIDSLFDDFTKIIENYREKIHLKYFTLKYYYTVI